MYQEASKEQKMQGRFKQFLRFSFRVWLANLFFVPFISITLMVACLAIAAVFYSVASLLGLLYNL